MPVISFNHLSFLWPLFVDLAFYSALFCFVRWLVKPLFSSSPFHNIPGPPPESWFKGNLGQLFNAKGLPFHQDIVDRYGGMVKVHGFFGDEQLYISDPVALQSIISKDQDAFEETSVFIETNKVIFGPGLVATTGDHHKKQRKIVSPVFSTTQLKALAPVFYDIADKLADVLGRESQAQVLKTGRGVLDMSDWMCRVALETVGQTILGYSFDPLDSPHNNPYTSAVKELIPTIFSLSLLRQFAPFLSKIGSPAFRRWIVEHTPNTAVQKVKAISDVMHETAQDILRQKQETLAAETGSNEASRANDIISVLLRVNENAKGGEQLSESELTGQMTVMIFGAQDTTSSALSRMLYLLSTNNDIQDQVRDELRAAFRTRKSAGNNSECLDYDELSALPLLDAIIKETLRLYPPVPFVRRTAVKERAIPYLPSEDQPLSSVTIPVGTTLFVGIAGSNCLESVWGPDAKEWKPRRWLSDGPKISSARLPGIYAGIMSFLGGGRSCIGYKFALIEMKIILSVLLMRFRFSSTDDHIVWNLSQIISPSVRTMSDSDGGPLAVEKKGLPLIVQMLEDAA